MTSDDAGRRRRPWSVVVIVVAGVVVAGLVGAVLLARVPVPFVDGPLDAGAEVWVAKPLDATATGAAWGNVELRNRSAVPAVVRSVRILYGEGHLELATEPVFWGPHRELTTGSGGLITSPTPLSAEWAALERFPVAGYVIGPAPTNPPPDGPDYTDAELLVEFRAPSEVSSVTGVVVTYVTGGRRYVQRIRSTFTVCPAGHAGECRAQGEP